MLTRLSTLALSLVFVLALAASTAAAQPVKTSVGTFTATEQGLTLKNGDFFTVYISKTQDGLWVIKAAMDDPEPVATIDETGGREEFVQVSLLVYNPRSEMWTYFSSDFEGTRTIRGNGQNVFITPGALSELNGELIINPERDNELPVHIAYRGNNNWSIFQK